MDAAANGVAEEQDDQQGIDQQDIFYRMALFLATVRICSQTGRAGRC
jgi:hypothetical protein